MYSELKTNFKNFYFYSHSFESHIVMIFKKENEKLTLQLPTSLYDEYRLNHEGEKLEMIFDYVFSTNSLSPWAKKIVDQAEVLSENESKKLRMKEVVGVSDEER